MKSALYNTGDLNYYFLQPGYIYCTTAPTAIETILGSCVSLCLFDKMQHFGGMNHYIYPVAHSRQTATAQYGNAAIIGLYNSLIELGARKDMMVAKLFGGAYIKSNDDSKLISGQNVEICHTILEKLNISIISEDIGGTMGRKVVYFNHLNKVFIKKIRSSVEITDMFCDSQDTKNI